MERLGMFSAGLLIAAGFLLLYQVFLVANNLEIMRKGCSDLRRFMQAVEWVKRAGGREGVERKILLGFIRIGLLIFAGTISIVHFSR